MTQTQMQKKKSSSTISTEEDEYDIKEDDDEEEKEYKSKMKAKKLQDKKKEHAAKLEEIIKKEKEEMKQKLKDKVKTTKDEMKLKKEAAKPPPKSKTKPKADEPPAPKPTPKPKLKADEPPSPKAKPKTKADETPPPAPKPKPKPKTDEPSLVPPVPPAPKSQKTQALIAALNELSKANQEYNSAKQLFRDKIINEKELAKAKALVDKAIKKRKEAEEMIPEETKPEPEKEKPEKEKESSKKSDEIIAKNLKEWFHQIAKLYKESDEYIDDISHIMTNGLIDILEKPDCAKSDNIGHNGYNDYAECIVDPILDSLYQESSQLIRLFDYKYSYGRVPVPPSEKHINLFVSINNNEIKQMQTHIDNIMNMPDSSNIGFYFKNDSFDELERFVEKNLLNNEEFCNIIKEHGDDIPKMIEELTKFGESVESDKYGEFMQLVKSPGDKFGIRNNKMPHLKTSDYIHVKINYPKDTNFNKKTGAYETRFLPNKKLDYKLPIDIVQADTGDIITYLPISVVMWHKGTHYTSMILVENKWIHIDDKNIEYKDCKRDNAKPIGIIYIKKDLYDQKLDAGTLRGIDDIKGITNVTPKKDCWCNSGIQMLLNVHNLGIYFKLILFLSKNFLGLRPRII